MKQKTLDILMDTMEKTKKKFDEAVRDDSAFEVANYSHQITETAATILEHMRSEYEAQAIEDILKQEGGAAK